MTIFKSIIIDWRIPTKHTNLSEKDTKHQVLKDFESPFEYPKDPHGSHRSHGWNGRSKSAGSVATIFTFRRWWRGWKSTIPVWHISELEKSAQERIYLKLVEEIERITSSCN